jgi:hypothetical protein
MSYKDRPFAMINAGNIDNNTNDPNDIVKTSLAIMNIIYNYNTQKASYYPEFRINWQKNMVADEVAHIIVALGDLAAGAVDRHNRLMAECHNSKDYSKMHEAHTAFAEYIMLQRTGFKLKYQLCYYQEEFYGPDNTISPEMPTPEEMDGVYEVMPVELYKELRNLRVVDAFGIDVEHESFDDRHNL